MSDHLKSKKVKNRIKIIVSCLILCGVAITALSLCLSSCQNTETSSVQTIQTGTNFQGDPTFYPSSERSDLPDNVIAVPYISQENTMPTGCELVSAVMVLQFYGYDISVDTFVDHYVDLDPIGTSSDGTILAGDPRNVFVGNPRTSDSYGCFAPVIVSAMNRVTNGLQVAQDLTGTELEDLAQTYIANGMPVLVWVSINMASTYPSDTWFIQETGEWFTWTANEHCMVLVGYDDFGYYLMDPYNSNGLVYYDKALVAQRYKEMGKQAVVLI